jgi:large subunit ribosomal protein L24
MFKIRRDDSVYVITGKDKGKKGKVLKVFPAVGRAIVAGINMVKKHRRKTRDDQPGGVVQLEMPIAISNLMLFCKHCNRPVRPGISVLKDGSKTRICRKCKEVL